MPKVLELVGQRFGRLTVIKRVVNNKYGRSQWLCQCDCGNIKGIDSGSLKKGLTKSCGCLNSELTIRRNYKHGQATKADKSKIYRIWVSMHNRCNNSKNRDYKDYGGRGITICERWNKFKNFLEDMGERPKGLTLDRRDNDGDYEPKNCRWATPQEQARNSRACKLNSLRVKNIKQCLTKGKLTQRTLGYIFGVAPTTICNIANGNSWADIAI